MERNYDLYKQLLNMDGIPGHEKEIKKFVKQELQKYTDTILEDGMGGVFGVLEGDGPTIMFCGHMDEVGYMVSGITPKGLLKLLPIGGMNPEVYLSQVMHVVINKDKKIKGIIGAMPPHLTKGEKKPITHEELLLDIGADNYDNAVAMGVKIGQQVVSENDFFFTEDNKKIEVWSDYQTYDKKDNYVSASGSTKIKYEDYYATGPKLNVFADKATNKLNEAVFVGRSKIETRGRTIEADRITITMNPKDFKAEGNVKSVIPNIGN